MAKVHWRHMGVKYRFILFKVSFTIVCPNLSLFIFIIFCLLYLISKTRVFLNCWIYWFVPFGFRRGVEKLYDLLLFVCLMTDVTSVFRRWWSEIRSPSVTASNAKATLSLSLIPMWLGIRCRTTFFSCLTILTTMSFNQKLYLFDSNSCIEAFESVHIMIFLCS